MPTRARLSDAAVTEEVAGVMGGAVVLALGTTTSAPLLQSTYMYMYMYATHYMYIVQSLSHTCILYPIEVHVHVHVYVCSYMYINVHMINGKLCIH